MEGDKAAAGAVAPADPGLDRLRERYGCGPVRLAGTEAALYERHLLFDDVVDPAAAGPRERYEAVARSVRDILSRRRVRTGQTYERQNPSASIPGARRAPSRKVEAASERRLARRALQRTLPAPGVERGRGALPPADRRRPETETSDDAPRRPHLRDARRGRPRPPPRREPVRPLGQRPPQRLRLRHRAPARARPHADQPGAGLPAGRGDRAPVPARPGPRAGGRRGGRPRRAGQRSAPPPTASPGRARPPACGTASRSGCTRSGCSGSGASRSPTLARRRSRATRSSCRTSAWAIAAS